MKNTFKRSLLVRLAAMLLLLVAPALSGCKDDTSTEDAGNREEEYKVIDDALIQEYLTRKGITAGTGLNQYERTESGLYLVSLVQAPSADKTIVSGNTAEIKYIGRFLRERNENTVFDNSTERGTPCGCSSVLVGAGQVIKGWDEGLLRMKRGDRKLLLVPSYLAYGPAGRDGIPGDEPLLFDMEILTVR